MLTVVTYRWGAKYSAVDVAKLRTGFERHLRERHNFYCIDPTDGPDDYLLKLRGCFCRLRLFDPEYQRRLGVDFGERLVCCDLDVVITGRLDPLFDRPESFVILQGANASNPCPYNGSLWMLRGGANADVWRDFDLAKARQIPHYEFPDDQGWIWHKIPRAAGWDVGPQSGIYAFKKPGWPAGEELPPDARMVAFVGWRKPSAFRHLPWVHKHWTAH